jgi:hypothetical protein
MGGMRRMDDAGAGEKLFCTVVIRSVGELADQGCVESSMPTINA